MPREGDIFADLPGKRDRLLPVGLDILGEQEGIHPRLVILGQVGGQQALAEMKAFTRGGKQLDSAYNFDFLYALRPAAPLVRARLSQWDGTPGEGWPSWAFSNHDAPRAVSRRAQDGDTERTARLNMLLLLALRGNPIIYQGEELGLPQGEVAFEDLCHPEAIANWPHTLGRDGARIPMPWRENAPNAGFSGAAHTWLRSDPAHAAFAVDRQERQSALDPQSHPRSACPAARAPCTGKRRDHARSRRWLPSCAMIPQARCCAPSIWARRRSNGHCPGALAARGRLLARESAVGRQGNLPLVPAPGSGYWAVNDAEHD